MDRANYISRMHCHQKVLLSLLEQSLRADSYSKKKDIVKKAKKFNKELTKERFDLYASYNILGSDIWYEITSDFINFIRKLIKE